jgi:hypothetical protein
MFTHHVAGIAASLALTLASGLIPHRMTGTMAHIDSAEFTYCEALTAPPLTRYVSRVFAVPTGAAADLPALFGEAIKAKHHPRPQELACEKRFATHGEADTARERRLSGTGQVLKMPTVAVEWSYAPAAP